MIKKVKRATAGFQNTKISLNLFIFSCQNQTKKGTQYCKKPQYLAGTFLNQIFCILPQVGQ